MIKKFESYSLWDKAYSNTEKLKVDSTPYISYVNICKSCNEVTEIESTRERQIIGNSHQVIVLCKECNENFVMDEDKRSTYEYLLKNK